MAKNIKLNIKNTQIAQAINLSGLKSKLAKKKEEEAPQKTPSKLAAKKVKSESEEMPKEEFPRIRARSKSAFAESNPEIKESHEEQEPAVIETAAIEPEVVSLRETPVKMKTSAEIREEIFGSSQSQEKETAAFSKYVEDIPTPVKDEREEAPPAVIERLPQPHAKRMEAPPQLKERQPYEKLGPTGRHIKDFIKPKPVHHAAPAKKTAEEGKLAPTKILEGEVGRDKSRPKTKGFEEEIKLSDDEASRKSKAAKFKEFKDVRPAKRQEGGRFDARDRHGLRESEDDQQWRKRRGKRMTQVQEDLTIRPASLKIRLPISIKDLASEMKLKSSQLVGKLFLQGIVATLNDLLEDETTIQLLGQEFGCEIEIDTTEEKRIQITDKSIKEELQQTPPNQLEIRPPVVVFMGHVDHGKTSLIDTIRKSNRAAGEAGAITQHIGAFRCSTPVGDIAVLDTPGHEAFSAMRARGADVTDIVVLVIAGDEGMKQQTIEAMEHAKAANVIIVVAINKCDKPNFNTEMVYRQLAEKELLPEVWGGQTITVNCSATTGEGIKELLEMLALQSEILELRANPHTRARGTVLESEMHKGMGAVATVLVQNGTLKIGDAVVFGQHWGRVKTMRDEFGKELKDASPSTPVEITGLSGLPEAGQEFIVVKNEREAREIAEARTEGARQINLMQKKKITMDNILQQASTSGKKILNLVLRADVQGSLEALKAALMKIQSDKVEINMISASVGEVSESDVQLAAASKAVIIGFHTAIEGHAEPLVKQLGVQVRSHDIIYHAIDDVKLLMAGTLDRIAQETDKGQALVKAIFKSSHTGLIAGCQVIEGTIHRNHHIRVKREGEVIWKGTISSLKRVKEDVREVQKGLECGILLNNFTDIKEGDILEAYEVTYIAQEL